MEATWREIYKEEPRIARIGEIQGHAHCSRYCTAFAGGFHNLQDEGIYSSEGAGRVAARRGGQQIFTAELCLMAIRAVAMDENTCVIFDSHGPSQ